MKCQSKIINLITLLATFTLFTGCAYFNTLWNGWQAFDGGVKTKSKLELEKNDSSKIVESTKKDFERAVIKSERCVRSFPRHTKFHDDAFYLKGRALYEMNAFSEATLPFKTIQRDFPKSKRIPESWLWLGKSYAAAGDYPNAEQAYQYCIDNFPELNKNEEVTLLQAELAVYTKGKSQAIPFLEEALKRVTNPERRLSIINRLAGLYIAFEQYDNALKHLTNIPKFDKKYRELYFETRNKEFNCYSELRQYDKAQSVLNALLSNRHLIDHHSEIQLELAVLFIDQQKFEDARKILLNLTSSTKTNETVAHAWYNLAGIYIDVDSKLPEGINALTKAIEMTKDESIRVDGKRRLAGLQTIKTYTDSLKAGVPDSIDQWALRFKLGERYWLDAKLPDSALVQYEKILADTTVSKLIHVKTLFSKGWVLWEMKKDTVSGQKIFNTIVTEYPTFAEAKECQRLLNIPVTIMVRRDSAEVKFREAEQLRLQTSGYSKDVYYAYLLTAMKYPEIKDIAAKSLYSAGWVINSREDEGQAVDTAAAKIFGRLCRDYPESDQCKAVSTMLQQEQVKGFVDTYSKFLEAKKKEPDLLDKEIIAADKKKSSIKDLPPIEIPDFTRWF